MEKPLSAELDRGSKLGITVRYNPAPAPLSTEVQKASEWQVSWLQGHLTRRAFPIEISGLISGFHRLLQLRDSEGLQPSSLLTGLFEPGTESVFY